ncbi:MAG: response regulator [Planctomycetaceae bacterium]
MSQTPSILFVDDEPNILEALKRLLIDEPYEVRTCTEPRAALTEVRRGFPAVVVADYYMPVMKGPDLLHKVREIHGGIVRMVLTGKPDLEGVLRAVNTGEVWRFVLKPWDDEELKMVLRTAIDYGELMRERDSLLVTLEKQRQTLANLERTNPGLTKLPERDQDGAFVLTPLKGQKRRG